MLTEAGKRLYDYSIAILQLMSRARYDIKENRDLPSGRIVVGLPPSYGRLFTLPLVEEFNNSLLNARLSIVEGLSAHLAEWIATGRADLAILLNPDHNSALDIQPILEDPVCLVGIAGSLENKKNGIKLEELTSLPLILPERTHAMRKMLETQAALAGIKLQVAWEISSVASILSLVRAGYGYAVLPRTSVAINSTTEHFALSPILEPTLTSTLCLATSSNKKPTPLVLHVHRLLKELALSKAVRPFN